jgi:uncharacterized protein (TIGR03067 family)
MKNMILAYSLCAAAALALLGCGQETPPSPRAADPHNTKSLQGDWIPVKGELGGKPMPDALLKTISLKLGNGTYDVSVGGQADQGTYEVDASTTPKSMVIKGTVGPNAGRTIPAIYELEDQTLRLCYDLSGAQRPREFSSAVGTKLYLVTYQRKP